MKPRFVLFLVIFLLLISGIVYLRSGYGVTSKVNSKEEVTSADKPANNDSVTPGAGANLVSID